MLAIKLAMDGLEEYLNCSKLRVILHPVKKHSLRQYAVCLVADPENFCGGLIKILSTKPQKFGCVVTRHVVRNLQWSGCFKGLGMEPPALKNFAFFCKNNLMLELV